MVMVKDKPSKQPNERVKIQGKVTVWQGEGRHKKVIVRKVENHWVDAGLKGIVSWLIGDTLHWNITSATYFWAYNVAVYLGTDAVTPTAHGHTGLASPIGTAPGTAPSSISGAARSNPASGQWKTSVTALWNAGTVSGTVGELALYLKPFTTFTVGWSNADGGATQSMISRLAVADGDFSSFSIDPTKSLTVQWEIVITYA